LSTNCCTNKCAMAATPLDLMWSERGCRKSGWERAIWFWWFIPGSFSYRSRFSLCFLFISLSRFLSHYLISLPLPLLSLLFSHNSPQWTDDQLGSCRFAGISQIPRAFRSTSKDCARCASLFVFSWKGRRQKKSQERPPIRGTKRKLRFRNKSARRVAQQSEHFTTVIAFQKKASIDPISAFTHCNVTEKQTPKLEGRAHVTRNLYDISGVRQRNTRTEGQVTTTRSFNILPAGWWHVLSHTASRTHKMNNLSMQPTKNLAADAPS